MDRISGRKKATKVSRKEKVKEKEKEGVKKHATVSTGGIGVPALNMSRQEERTLSPLSSPGTSPLGASASTRYIQLDALLSPRSSLSLAKSSAAPSPRVRRLSLSRKNEACEITNSVAAEISALEAEVDDLRHRLRAPPEQKDSVTLSEDLMAALNKLSALRASEAETLTRTMSGFMSVTKKKATVRSLSASLEGVSCLEFPAQPRGHHAKFWFCLSDSTLIYSEAEAGSALGHLEISSDMSVTSIDNHRFLVATENKAWEFQVDSAEDQIEWTKALAVAVGTGFISTPRRGVVLSTSPRSSKVMSLKSPRGATAVSRSLSSPRGPPPRDAPWSPPKRRSFRQTKGGVELQHADMYKTNCDHAHYAALKAKLSPHFQVKIEEKLGLYKLLTATLIDTCAWMITFSVQQYMDNVDLAYFLLCRDFLCTADQLVDGLQTAWGLLNTRSSSGSMPRRLHFLCRQWLESPVVAHDVEAEIAARNRFRRFCMYALADSYAYLAGTVIPPPDARRGYQLPLAPLEADVSSDKTAHTVLRTLPPEEFAEQLTLLNAEEFEAVPTRDYLLYVKNSSSKLPDSLQRVADNFNKVSQWVTFSIVSRDSEKSRVAEFKRMVLLAEKLHVLRNYHSTAAVLGGLGHTAISRLRKLQAAISTKYITRFHKLQQSYSPLRNYSNYRKLPMQRPSIPIMAIAMKDLLTTCESNPTYCSDEEVSINFTKIQMVGMILTEHQALRCYPSLSKNLQVAACILSIDPPSHDHSYLLSVKMEPVTSQQLEMEILRLQASLADVEEENRRLKKEATSLVAAAKRLSPPSCTCAYAKLFRAHLRAD